MAEKISEFTCLVRDMREAQKLYFDTRDKAYLKKAREIEKRVDDELQKTFGWIKNRQPAPQGRLLRCSRFQFPAACGHG